MRNKLATKLVLLVGAVALTCGLMSVPAHALVVVSPINSDGAFDLGAACNSACVSTNSSIPGLTLAYASTVGGVEAGPFASSYSASFGPASGPVIFQNSAFKIEYGSGSSVGCPLFVLVVGDGAAQNPDHYFFKLQGDPTTIKNWNGTENIVGAGFWALGAGSISYVAIYQTPEPASLLLLGSGLLSLAFWARKKFKEEA